MLPNNPSNASRRGNVEASITLLAVIVVVGIAVGSLLISSALRPRRSISVVGLGKEIVPATTARLSFAFATTGGSNEEAASNGEQQFSELLSSLNTFTPTDVKRIPYQVGQRTATVFQYATGAQMTVPSAQVPEVMKVLQGKTVQVGSLNYIAENEQDVKIRVQESAMENAREKADQIAKASKGKVGKVLVVSEQGSNAETGSAVTSVQEAGANQVEVQSAVTVTFELK